MDRASTHHIYNLIDFGRVQFFVWIIRLTRIQKSVTLVFNESLQLNQAKVGRTEGCSYLEFPIFCGIEIQPKFSFQRIATRVWLPRPTTRLGDQWVARASSRWLISSIWGWYTLLGQCARSLSCIWCVRCRREATISTLATAHRMRVIRERGRGEDEALIFKITACAIYESRNLNGLPPMHIILCHEDLQLRQGGVNRR